MLAGLVLTSGSVRAEDESKQRKFFESKIRPLLVKRCFKCHGNGKNKGGLQFGSRESLLKGGESGAAVVAGKPAESLLIEALNYESLEMPPDGKLPADEIELLTKWVADGAFWPLGDKPVRAASGAGDFTDEDRAWWSFQPLKDGSVPKAGDWGRNEVDRFIARQLAGAKLTPAGEADRRTLIRRVYFDLIGLPPKPDEIEAFLQDKSPKAYENLINRLLESPQYGERWARHWLDLVRYSESDGYKQDAFRPAMWRYRDYVIKSFNDDKPFDQFVREQIAGDELDPDNPEARVATGYWRLYLYEYNQRDVRTHWQAIIDELTDVSGEVFLGMSMGCAKCHDHKFDPIMREDYFRFQAYFSSILPRDDTPVAERDRIDAYEKQLAEWQAKTRDIRDQIAVIEKPYRESKWKFAVTKFPPDIRVIAGKPEAEWTSNDRQFMDLVNRQVQFEYDRISYKDADKKNLDELRKQLAEFDKLKPKPLPVAHTVTDVAGKPVGTYIPGDRSMRDITPGELTLFDPEPAVVKTIEAREPSTGRRAALADWLTSRDNPLTMRVIVNRVWQHHFGTGLVATASDFGRLGEQPSHPELLDWLTGWFIEKGYHFKDLHRLILLSSTYRQSATHPDVKRAERVDPQNRLRWRWDIRRLDAEQIRDSILAASGELQTQVGGPSVDDKAPRRSIYAKVIRNTPVELLKSFDATDGFNSSAKRSVTTTPTQSLLMMNGAWSLGRATALARRVDGLVPTDSASDLRQEVASIAWQLAYGRVPTNDELTSAVSFLNESAKSKPIIQNALAELKVTKSTAANIIGTDQSSNWKLANGSAMPREDFTVEAIIQLKSLYKDAHVRTIVSHWDGHTKRPGWSFGVTSEKSSYEPRNLILQLVGSVGSKDVPVYEVIPSNLRPELNRPYYVAASVDVDETTQTGITFYLKDLSKLDSPLKAAFVKHKVTRDFRPDVSLVLGDRDGIRGHRWDGLIDNLLISSSALKPEELFVNSGAGRNVVGLWQFDRADEPGADGSGTGNHLAVSGGSRPTRSGLPEQALVDLCHVLLNSNEFLYVD